MNEFQKTYRLSQLIQILQTALDKHGDMPVVTADPDTDCRMEIGVIHAAAEAMEEWPERIEITSAYDGRPYGCNPLPQ